MCMFACVGQIVRKQTKSTQVLYLCGSSQSRVDALGSILLCSPRPSVMLRLKVLSLLLACAVSPSSSADILENGMPIHWAQTVSQVSELPSQNDILNPNPWHFPHRLSFYRLLIAATDQYMGSMGTNATDSPLWGLPLQLGWMLTSGKMEIISIYVYIRIKANK